jgi:hypothetical protein
MGKDATPRLGDFDGLGLALETCGHGWRGAEPGDPVGTSTHLGLEVPAAGQRNRRGSHKSTP